MRITPDSISSRAPFLSRRAFLQRGAWAGASVGLAASRAEASLRSIAQAAAGPMSDADFWKAVRGEFMITDDVAYMNNGTLGPIPKPVFYTVVERYRELADDPGAPNTLQRRQVEDVRAMAAAFVGADVNEIALTRNTTEGMSTQKE